ncbi:MAG TPA: twin-arginine translocase TatA/TatE family subunit [Sphingomonadales bacterium]|nr:twin-arginine translocase TatA/TatE family subunit [Sphingomonadales bacterium]
MSIGIWQILIIVAIILLLFGRNKISELMGDLGRGISNFKKGLSEDKSREAEKKSLSDETKPKKPKG